VTANGAALQSWVAPVESAGGRFDTHVAERLQLPRSRVQTWIEQGMVLADGEAVKPSHRLRGGERITATPPQPGGDDRVVPEDLDFGTVLFSDEHLLAVDKPAGLVVHPGAGRRSGTLVNALLHHYPEIAGVGGAGRPGIVHRLDRDTSGVLLLARSDAAYLSLSRAFAERRVEKHYFAIVWGTLSRSVERTDPIGRHPTERQRMAVRANGRAASSTFVPLANHAGVTACDVRIETGRTHQIRVHAKAAGHPLIGDPTYGEARHRGLSRGPAQRALADFPRPALHAWSIAFSHPASGERMTITAPLPADLKQLWLDLGGTEAELSRSS
jgi:23S rRNA pseudouridine1911/1915/1917 synthase